LLFIVTEDVFVSATVLQSATCIIRHSHTETKQ